MLLKKKTKQKEQVLISSLVGKWDLLFLCFGEHLRQ